MLLSGILCVSMQEASPVSWGGHWRYKRRDENLLKVQNMELIEIYSEAKIQNIFMLRNFSSEALTPRQEEERNKMKLNNNKSTHSEATFCMKRNCQFPLSLPCTLNLLSYSFSCLRKHKKFCCKTFSQLNGEIKRKLIEVLRVWRKFFSLFFRENVLFVCSQCYALLLLYSRCCCCWVEKWEGGERGKIGGDEMELKGTSHLVKV